jgi:hypothetical protein
MGFPISIFQTSPGYNAPLLNGVVNPSGTVYSAIFTAPNSDGYSLSVFYTGTLSGTFTLWWSDVPFASQADDTQWIQDTNFSPVNPSGSAGSFGDEAGNSKGFYKRLKYVNSSGSGTITAYVNVPKTAAL